MARRRPGSQPQATIVHPNDPSIKTVVRKPKNSENGALKNILAANRRAIQVYDAAGQPALEEDGSKRVYIEQGWPLEATREFLRIHFVSHEGILDADGEPLKMTFVGESPTADEYTEPWLNVIEPTEEGKPAPAPISWASYIIREVRKPETFTANPPAAASAIT